MDEIEIFRKGFRKKSQGFWKWADFKEKKMLAFRQATPEYPWQITN